MTRELERRPPTLEYAEGRHGARQAVSGMPLSEEEPTGGQRAPIMVFGRRVP